MPNYTFSVKITKNNTLQLMAALATAERETLEEIGKKAAGYANEYAPVDTGDLASSYVYSVSTARKNVQVGSPLEYAGYVELGTGPNYQNPPGWVQNNSERGYHTTGPWWAIWKDGEWHLSNFVKAQPHLRPAFTSHMDEYIRIFKNNLKK